MKREIILKNVAGTPAGGTAGTVVAILDPGFRYYEVALDGVAGAAQTANTGFLDSRLYVGDKVQQLLSLDQREQFNKLLGGAPHGVQNDVAGGRFNLPFLFWEPYRKQYMATERYALDIPVGLAAKIEVDVLAAATAPNAKFRAIVEDLDDIPEANRNLADGMPVFAKWFRKTGIAVSGNGIDINDLVRKDRYGLIHITNPTGTTISNVQVTTDKGLIFDMSKVSNDALLVRCGMFPTLAALTGGTALTGFTICPEFSDNPLDVWNVANSKKFEIHVDFAGAGNGSVSVYTQRYGTPE